MTALSIANTDTAKWTMKQFFQAMGLGEQLKSGRIEVESDGNVRIKNSSNKLAWDAPLSTKADFDKMVKVLGQAVPSVHDKSEIVGDKQHVWNVFSSIRSSRFEQRVNSRWFRDQDDWDSELKDKYRTGRRFDLSLVKLPADRVQLLQTDRKLPGMKQIAKFFQQSDGVYMPVHPQELKTLAPKSDAKIEGVRCASSDRTLHATLPDVPNDFLVKVPLNDIVHDGIIRPISVSEAQGSIAMSDFMIDWIDKRKQKNDAFCFFPESMAIADSKTDSASIIRMTQPYPPAPGGKKTWSVCAYSLYAEDKDFPGEPPLFQRLINERPNKKVSEIDYFVDKIVGPMTKSVMRVALDMGAAHVPHGQNLFFEIGENGQPTGRAPHADLESFWPLPELAKPLKRKEFYKTYGYQYAKSKFEAKNWDTFRVYYLEGMLAPLLEAYIKEHPDQAGEIMTRVEQQIRGEIEQRKNVVKKFNGDGEPLRMYDRMRTGQFKLMSVVKEFFWQDTVDKIEEQQKAAQGDTKMSLFALQNASAKFNKKANSSTRFGKN